MSAAQILYFFYKKKSGVRSEIIKNSYPYSVFRPDFCWISKISSANQPIPGWKPTWSGQMQIESRVSGDLNPTWKPVHGRW
jgi:hypothetical protein